MLVRAFLGWSTRTNFWRRRPTLRARARESSPRTSPRARARRGLSLDVTRRLPRGLSLVRVGSSTSSREFTYKGSTRGNIGQVKFGDSRVCGEIWQTSVNVWPTCSRILKKRNMWMFADIVRCARKQNYFLAKRLQTWRSVWAWSGAKVESKISKQKFESNSGGHFSIF